ncbi:MAG: hypothetical protein ABI577_05445 [bacterium]
MDVVVAADDSVAPSIFAASLLAPQDDSASTPTMATAIPMSIRIGHLTSDGTLGRVGVMAP